MNFLTTTTTGAAEGGIGELFFEPTNFIANLKNMGVGMLVIFVIIAVIILATVAINKVFSKKD